MKKFAIALVVLTCGSFAAFADEANENQVAVSAEVADNSVADAQNDCECGCTETAN